MHPAIIVGTVRSLIVDVAMGQIPRSTERISSYYHYQQFALNTLLHASLHAADVSLHVASGCGSVSKDDEREMFIFVLHSFEYILLKNSDILQKHNGMLCAACN